MHEWGVKIQFVSNFFVFQDLIFYVVIFRDINIFGYVPNRVEKEHHSVPVHFFDFLARGLVDPALVLGHKLSRIDLGVVWDVFPAPIWGHDVATREIGVGFSLEIED